VLNLGVQNFSDVQQKHFKFGIEWTGEVENVRFAKNN